MNDYGAQFPYFPQQLMGQLTQQSTLNTNFLFGAAGTTNQVLYDALQQPVIAAVPVAPKEVLYSDLAWLDKRINEIRVKL